MKKLKFLKRMLKINMNLVSDYNALLYEHVKTLDHTSLPECENAYTLKKCIEDTKNIIKKMNEDIQILEEEEKTNVQE